MNDYERLAHLVMEVGKALKGEGGEVKDILKGALRRIADKRFDDGEGAEIVFCCDWCRMPIIRNHEQHDDCIPHEDAKGLRWFCRKKACMTECRKHLLEDYKAIGKVIDLLKED